MRTYLTKATGNVDRERRAERNAASLRAPSIRSAGIRTINFSPREHTEGRIKQRSRTRSRAAVRRRGQREREREREREKGREGGREREKERERFSRVRCTNVTTEEGTEGGKSRGQARRLVRGPPFFPRRPFSPDLPLPSLPPSRPSLPFPFHCFSLSPPTTQRTYYRQPGCIARAYTHHTHTPARFRSLFPRPFRLRAIAPSSSRQLGGKPDTWFSWRPFSNKGLPPAAS